MCCAASRLGLWLVQPNIKYITRDFSPRGWRGAAESCLNHSLPSKAEVKNAWRYTFTLLCTFKVCRGKKFLCFILLHLYILKKMLKLWDRVPGK
jgi:hypothetical protein